MKKNFEKTNAIRILEQRKIKFNIYNYSDTGAISGAQVAEVLKEDPKTVFKTLVTVGKSGNHYVFLVPVLLELDLKKCAAVVDEKNIEMVKSKELLQLTGYIHGGCSPIGMKKFFKTVIDKSAVNCDKIIFSGGKIGYQIETNLEELKKVIDFELNDIVK
ncbi:ybaK/EbsC family protein [Clostridium sp. CAG:921]|nr:ybaK/EbsC family protein [Clostridium sp. CAG:921]